jgi:hypothetical protein
MFKREHSGCRRLIGEGHQNLQTGLAKYEEDFDERKDPAGRKYFWLTGDFVISTKAKIPTWCPWQITMKRWYPYNLI